ncbi:MAG: serine/threonine-protein kinase [Actinomycetota bacterium]
MPNATSREIAGRYTLTDRLGKGGMGTVWKAHDSVLKRSVAIKEVKLPSALSSGDSDVVRDRVMREAQTAAGLAHPNAVTVYDVVQEDGHTFIVMELVDAPSLEEKVRREGPLTPEETARIGLDVLGALEAAHQQGIIHRDVKPANVMCSPGGRAKLADFGIAAVKGDPKLTATGLVLGSPSYMAPEQASKDDAGPGSDLWALGATLYFAVEGEAPFDRGQAIPTLTAVVHDEPRAMTRAGTLAPVITALLAKEPDERPDAATLREMLGNVASGSDTHAATAVAAAGTATKLETKPVSQMTGVEARRAARDAGRVHSRPNLDTRSERDSRPWLWWLGGLVILALLAAFILPRLGGDETGSEGRRRGQKQGAAADNQSAEDGDTAPAEDAEEPAVPEDWNTYTDEATGYTISYPADWDVAPIDTRTDFVEPGTGTYLRIDYTDEPGPDAMAQIEESGEPGFASSHGDYERVQLTPTTFAGTDNAALWEYTYEGQHAYNLQFVTADGEWGFALNFQTAEENWESSQGIWEQLKASFQLPE